MSTLRAKNPKSREKRLDTITAYYGGIQPLLDEYAAAAVPQRIRTFSQGTADDLICALRLLAGIRNAVTIVHGPRGCAAAQLYHETVGGSRRWGVTNLDERDTIMGADAKLRVTVKAFWRLYRPELLFIVATPAVAINNDDIQSVADELGDELSVPIIPVYVSGFASRCAASGYDTALHSLARQFARGRGERGRSLVNLVSVAETAADRAEAERLLGELGLGVTTLPDGADAERFGRIGHAGQTLLLDPDRGDYLGGVLQATFGIPVVESGRPIGVAATGAWLAAIGSETGREREAAELHVRSAATLNDLLEEAPLRGVRVCLGLPTATAFAVADLVRELGGEVVGITVDQIDRRHGSRLVELQRITPNLQLHVAADQPFEESNILRRLRPGLYVGGAGTLVQAAHLGIPAVSPDRTPLIGYRGVTAFAHAAARALKNSSFVTALAGNGQPYLDAWYRRSPNWHIKQEVK